MVQAIPNNNSDFQYGGSGVPAQNEDPADFQSYLKQKDGPPQQQSPIDMIAAQRQSNFGAPTAETSNNLGPAPENFGPPGISQLSGDNSPNFGAPGFGASPVTGADGAQKGGSPLGAGDLQKKPKPPPPKLPPATIASVENQEADNMFNAAIGNMKIKDPDPGAWQ